MIFKTKRWRMEVDVKRTRAYYEEYAESGKATILQRNQQAYFDKVLTPGAKGFLRMLGIVNHLPMGFGESCLVDGQVRHIPIAYPVFGHYCGSESGCLRIGADGRLVRRGAYSADSLKVFHLYPAGGDLADRCRPLFPGFPGPLLILDCGAMFADWVLEEPCPLPTGEALRAEKKKTRRANLTKALQWLLEAEGFQPQMLDDDEMRAVYDGWLQTFAGTPDHTANPRLHQGFSEARGLDVPRIDKAYGALPAGEYHLMLGQRDACAHIQSDHLPSLRLLDALLKNEIYLVDAAKSYCLYGQSDWMYAPYVLAAPCAASPAREQSATYYEPCMKELQLEMMLHISGNKWEKGAAKEWKRVKTEYLRHFVPQKRRRLGARMLKGNCPSSLWYTFYSLIPALCRGETANARYDALRDEHFSVYVHGENCDLYKPESVCSLETQRRERFMIFMRGTDSDLLYHVRGELPSAAQLARFVRMDIYVCPESVEWIYALDHEGMGPYFLSRRY